MARARKGDPSEERRRGFKGFELVARVRGNRAEILKVPLGSPPSKGKVISRLPGRVPATKTKLGDPKLGRKLESAFRKAVKLSLQKA